MYRLLFVLIDIPILIQSYFIYFKGDDDDDVGYEASPGLKNEESSGLPYADGQSAAPIVSTKDSTIIATAVAAEGETGGATSSSDEGNINILNLPSICIT